VLLGARAIQAFGAAALTPNSLGVVLPLFPPHRRPVAIGAWGAIAGLGAATGPVLGGLLAEASWRWIFLVNLPLGIVALTLVPRLVREIRDEAASRFPDALGAVLLAAAIGLLTLGLSQGPGWQWDIRVFGSLVVAGVLAAVFLWRSDRHPAPVVELPMLRVRTFALAMAGSIVFWAGFAAFLLSSALFLTGVWGFSILEAGLGLAPGPAVSAVFAVIGGRLSGRFGPGRVGAAGGILFAVAGLWLLARLTAGSDYLFDFLPAQLIGGAGVGLVLPTLVAITVADLRPARLSTGIAVYTMFRQIGAALGVALWLALLGTSSPREADAFVPGWAFLSVTGAVTALVLLSTIRFLPASRPTAPAPAASSG
jgi:MFS family permease